MLARTFFCLALALFTPDLRFAPLASAEDARVIDDRRFVPLNEAVENFNSTYRSNPESRQEPEVTVDEVKAAILLAKSTEQTEIPREITERLEMVVRNSMLLAEMNLYLQQQVDLGGAEFFDVWNVQLMVSDGIVVPIRSRVVRVRTVAEEVKRLEAELINSKDLPGYSTKGLEISDRIQKLKARSKKTATRGEPVGQTDVAESDESATRNYYERAYRTQTAVSQLAPQAGKSDSAEINKTGIEGISVLKAQVNQGKAYEFLVNVKLDRPMHVAARFTAMATNGEMVTTQQGALVTESTVSFRYTLDKDSAAKARVEIVLSDYKMQGGVAVATKVRSEQMVRFSDYADREQVLPKMVQTRTGYGAVSEEHIREIMKIKRLVEVHTEETKADVSTVVVFGGKLNKVVVHPGTSMLVDLPKASKQFYWHDGGAPQVVGGPEVKQEFTYVSCEWLSNGRIVWKCLAQARGPDRDGGENEPKQPSGEQPTKVERAPE